MKPAIEARCILLDVEGTVSPISFVHEVMFPWARDRVDRFLAGHWGEPGVEACLDLLAIDAGATGRQDWLPAQDAAAARSMVVRLVHDLMDRDAKVTGLKRLQGMIWQSGFESGELVAELFPDVPPALRAWQAGGLDLRIYSSGSVQAQRLFFGHTSAGNLLPLFSGHYDTTIGGKRESGSYARIAADVPCPPCEIAFLSDVPEELHAAAVAGCQTVLVRRPGNAPVPPGDGIEIGSLDELEVVPPQTRL